MRAVLEMYYDRGPKPSPAAVRTVGQLSLRAVPGVWNLVFMEFDLGSDSALTPLPKPVIDTGLGPRADSRDPAESVIDYRETDGFQAHGLDRGGERCRVDELREDDEGAPDHGRPRARRAFLVADGVLPSNEGRGYVLRRVIRRAVQQARGIGLTDFWRISNLVTDQMAYWYPELEENRERVAEAIRAEEERFSQTLERGMGLFEEVAAGGAISGEDAFPSPRHLRLPAGADPRVGARARTRRGRGRVHAPDGRAARGGARVLRPRSRVRSG